MTRLAWVQPIDSHLFSFMPFLSALVGPRSPTAKGPSWIDRTGIVSIEWVALEIDALMECIPQTKKS